MTSPWDKKWILSLFCPTIFYLVTKRAYHLVTFIGFCDYIVLPQGSHNISFQLYLYNNVLTRNFQAPVYEYELSEEEASGDEEKLVEHDRAVNVDQMNNEFIARSQEVGGQS